jgi:hypothetical protein
MARSKNLLCSDGVTILCWACVASQRRVLELEPKVATGPDLHCDTCRDLHARRQETAPYTRRTLNNVEYEFPTEPDEARRWRLMLAVMRHEQRLDRDLASSMLANAKAIPGAFEGDVRQLEEAYRKRFGHDTINPTKSVRYRDAG